MSNPIDPGYCVAALDEAIYLKDYQSMGRRKACIERYFKFYNGRRYHQSLDCATPDQIYAGGLQNTLFRGASP